uniref:Uncharacterized protein n=1 Tax=Thermus caliditerrae TaxID=1330700 RepID=A0A7C5VGP4_9DEIN
MAFGVTQEVVEALLSLEGLIRGPLHTRLWREAGVKVWRTASLPEGVGSVHLETEDGELQVHFARERYGYQARTRWGLVTGNGEGFSGNPMALIGVMGHVPTLEGGLKAFLEEPGLLPPPVARARRKPLLDFALRGRSGLPRPLSRLLEVALEVPEAAPVFLRRVGEWVLREGGVLAERVLPGTYEARFGGKRGAFHWRVEGEEERMEVKLAELWLEYSGKRVGLKAPW